MKITRYPQPFNKKVVEYTAEDICKALGLDINMVDFETGGMHIYFNIAKSAGDTAVTVITYEEACNV